MRLFVSLLAASLALSVGQAHAQSQELRVGFIPVMGAAQIFVAEGEGWTKQAGIPLAMSAFESGPNMIQALRSGTLDVYVAGLAPLLVARSKGIDVRVVAATVVEEMGFAAGASFAPFFDGRTPAQAFKAFHEKTGRPAKLATQPIGSGPNTTLKYWLWEVVKADKADVQIVEMGIDATQGAIADRRGRGRLDPRARAHHRAQAESQDQADRDRRGHVPEFSRRRGGCARRVRRQEPQGGGGLVRVVVRATNLLKDDPKRAASLRRRGVRQGPGPGERSARSDQVAADASSPPIRAASWSRRRSCRTTRSSSGRWPRRRRWMACSTCLGV